MLPEAYVDFGDLCRMMVAPIRLRLLLTGIELKVFNHLARPASADAVAQALGTHPGNTRVFLDGLAAINLLRKKGGLYRNSPVAQTYLVEGSPIYLGTNLQMQSSISASLENFSKLIKEGPPPRSESAFSIESFVQIASVSASSELAYDAQAMVDIASGLPEFPSFRRMLDLGGGPGLVGMAVVAAHPSMKGVIFDLPAVVAVAESFIEKYGMNDRVTVLGGDGFRDSFGEDYDLVLACSSLQFDKGNLDHVVKKVYDALNTRGVFVSYFTGLTDEVTKPEVHVLSSLPIALAGLNTRYDQGFVAESMLRAGFRSVHSWTLSTPWGPIDVDVARK